MHLLVKDRSISSTISSIWKYNPRLLYWPLLTQCCPWLCPILLSHINSYCSHLEYWERGGSVWTEVPWKRTAGVHQLQDLWGHGQGADQTAGRTCCPETQGSGRYVFSDCRPSEHVIPSNLLLDFELSDFPFQKLWRASCLSWRRAALSDFLTSSEQLRYHFHCPLPLYTYNWTLLNINWPFYVR